MYAQPKHNLVCVQLCGALLSDTTHEKHQKKKKQQQMWLIFAQ